MFSTLYCIFFFILNPLKISSAICFNLDKLKILSSGNGLRYLDPEDLFFKIVLSRLFPFY